MKSSKTIRLISSVLAFVMIAAVLSFIPSSNSSVKAATTYNNATIKSYENQITSLQNKRNAVQKQLDNLSGEQAVSDAKAALIDQTIELTEDKIEQSNLLLSELKAEIEQHRFDIAELEADISRQFQRFRSRVRIAYEEGNISYLEMILGAQDLTDFLSRFEYINCMVEYDNRIMKSYIADKEELEVQKADLESKEELQEQYALELEEEKNQLEDMRKEVDDLRAEIRTKYAAAWSDYSKLKAEEEKKSAELEEYIKRLAAMNNPYVGGEFIWPLDHRFNYISSGFGYRWLWGSRDYHGGIDIPCTLNTTIIASNSGTVLIAEYHSSYGNYVLIDHGGGKTTLYAHNTSLLVKKGDYVVQGQAIAKAGTTGASTGVHCHFEYRLDGVRYDPLTVVAQP